MRGVDTDRKSPYDSGSYASSATYVTRGDGGCKRHVNPLKRILWEAAAIMGLTSGECS
ncbi:MAG: hypothetical protein ACLTS6_16960 [Anaerobutyricum sp.]